MKLTTQHSGRRRFAFAALSLPLTAGLILSGCASDEQSGASGGEERTDATLYETAVAKAKELAGDEKLDASLEFIGVNGGAEGEVLQSVYKAFTEATGTKVDYTGTQDINSIVQSRVQAGNAPDVVDQSLGVALDYAEQGKLLDMSEVVGDDQLQGSYAQGLLDSASFDGKVFGIYQGFNNFMVWYNPEQYTGPEEPKTWQELADWTDAQAADGTPAWCIAEEAGGGSGFPGAQFIENLFAKTYGPEKLRQWGGGELPWTSDEVKSAWEMFGDIATDDSKVSGGVEGSLAAPIATGYNGLVSDPASCQAALWGSWVPGLIGETAKPGENIDFFKVPGDSDEFASTEIFQTTVSTAFNDTPTVRAFMQYIASDEAQALLASADQWTVANQNVPTDTYDSVMLQKAADTYFGDDVTLAIGPNVMANAAVSAAFYKGVVSYLQDPSSLDKVLQSIQDAADGS
jgi:alpha-glucoside transport system substrate-binding protein